MRLGIISVVDFVEVLDFIYDEERGVTLGYISSDEYLMD